MGERAQTRGASLAERRPRRVQAFGHVLAATVVGLVGAWIGMSLLARTTVPIGPFRVELQAGFGRGETVLALPPFGALTADTHLAPLALSATLIDVGVQRLTDAVNRQGIDGLVAGVERDAGEQLRPLALRGLVVAALGGTVLALLVFRSRWRLVALSGGVALLSILACLAMVQVTFRPSAFTEPRYSGSLSLAPKLIGPVREATDRIGDLRAGLRQIVDGTVRAYTTLQSLPLAEDAIRVLHISDIHASVLGMDFAQEVARGFDVDIVVDTGDITSFATPVEELIASEIPDFGRPYVFVRGSHDSLALQNAIARQSNALVLDGRYETIEGLTLYGLGHPAFTPARGVPVDDEAFAEAARSSGAVIGSALDGVDERFDVVVVHDDRMAEAVAGRVPLVISGHFHETTATVRNGTLFLRIGTTGGSGAGIFRDLAVPFSAEVLYFSRDTQPGLLAYDVIEQLPESGSLTVQRVNVVQEFGVLSPTPSPSQTASVTEAPSPGIATSSPSSAP
ncbi:MAG TPA: metallophosphoesterase [Actinomycetota bacterium]|nr:metallophosphoesterase [Actinomycetota bacterium]